MKKKSLQIQQLDNKMLNYNNLKNVVPPPTGWIKSIRVALGMSMEQLGNKLGVTKQNVMDIERREANDAITLRALKETARVMDMQLVYGFVPNDGSLEMLIERKARELALNIISRTNTSMILEDQGNSEERLSKAIEERTQSIINEMPKALWD